MNLYFRFGQILAADLGCGSIAPRFNRLGNINQAECLRNLTSEFITRHPGTFGRSKLGPKGTQAVIDGAYSDTPFLPKSISDDKLLIAPTHMADIGTYVVGLK